ncbi:MAG: UvrD-helicase domain-containing protein [Woeseia sp.]
MSDDASLLAADEYARQSALDITRSFIVQAPAGSGKTELLIQRYLCLLSTVENPEEILAITFTRKAASEMQLRLLSAMRDAKEGRDADQPHQRTTRDAAQRALERDASKGWRLLESPQRLRVQTIDALNASIARTLPFSSGLGASVDVASDDAIRLLYGSAAAATLDWLASADSQNAAAVETLLVHLDNNTALYIGHLTRMLQSRDQWLSITGSGNDQSLDADALRTRLEKSIADQVTAQLRKVAALVPADLVTEILYLARYAARNVSADSPPAQQLRLLEFCEHMPGAEPSTIGVWCGLAELLLTRAGGWRKTVNRNVGFPPGDTGEKQRMLALLERLNRQELLAVELSQLRVLPPVQYADEQWNVLLALFRLLPLAVAELRRMFAEQRVTDYIEIAMAAHNALGNVEDPGDMALLLDYSIQHLLIDEMQDTSISQYELLVKLVAGWQPGDGRTMFCVGDPMQSIYRFRNAEVGEFLLARQKGVGPVQLDALVLRRNFRSGENLVHWFNTIFGSIFPLADDVATGAIAYAESVPVEAQSGSGRIQVHPLFGVSGEEEAEYGVRVIQECLLEQGAQSTALLVRSRTQLPRLLAKLRATGIGYQALDIDRLTDLPEIIDVLALTRALCHRDDRIAWLALLRSPWAGFSWTDLHALVRNDARQSVWELMQDEERVDALSPDARSRIELLRQELLPFLEGNGTATLQESIERIWFRLGGPAILSDATQTTNVYRFFDVLARMESCGTLPDVAQLERQLELERVATPVDSTTRLQVMTMHKAKGLEFDQVILYGLGHRTHGDRASVLSWLNAPDRDGGEEFLISPLGPRTQLEGDPLHKLIETKLRDKDRLETDRLLYVACTRARRTLHLIGHVPVSADGTELRDPQAGSLLQRIWPCVKPDYVAAFSASDRIAEERERYRAELREPVLYRTRDFLPQPPVNRLPRRTNALVPGRAIEDRPVDYYWVGSVARHAGSIVHRLLQHFTAGILTVDPIDDAVVDRLARRWANEVGVPEADTDSVCERVRDALKYTLEDDKGSWIVFGPGTTELPVTGIWNGQIESVVLDRIRTDSDGVHWIIDYKTSTHEGGELDQFLQQEMDRYRPQLVKYAALYRSLTKAPIRAALYFPLLQAFREVSIDRISSLLE